MKRYGWDGRTRCPENYGKAYAEADVVPGDRVDADGRIATVIEWTENGGEYVGRYSPDKFVFIRPDSGDKPAGYFPRFITKL